MSTEIFHTIISIFAAIVLFLFSLQGFSKELQEVGSDKLKSWLSRVTQNKYKGFVVGVFTTAIIQSSSAVSSIVVALIDSGIITFSNSIGVLIGTNVGTTFTAWLVAFKIKNLGSILIVVGTLLSAIPHRMRLIGKSVFYLGLILFALDLINLTLSPLKEAPIFVEILSYSDVLLLGLLAGAIVTALVQSSSVVTGLVIILASQGLIGLLGAITVLLGSNIGTTSTALLASLKMSIHARKAAKANFYFNLIGVLLFLPFLHPFKNLVFQISLPLTYQIAIAHLLFNTIIALLFLFFSKWFLKLFPEEKTQKI